MAGAGHSGCWTLDVEAVPKDGVMCVMRMARFLSPLSDRSSRPEYLRRTKYNGRCPLEKTSCEKRELTWNA
ncbi:hypothetical protein I305_04909 [Cryptococcus gattii E566]|uniref:Uncharacterized protein n=2 Tax=Cryptococcus gattii TaxID=37769 RepID=E6RFT9_CRYGW|nr:Hypothetical Protein CGB_N0320W [Cryptococcus gattii WM276]ADV25639.1 Hypothetical Protein CGB_N0320W [Cryptococcus gattii WM276]KIR78185.1 hypothetical protein I306_04804 [Cryptococcus gattii EJB2]KIY32750.1 hypothetical protein I305_04909 [Cryptococcus gattii E566]KJE01857.1 hypothetical protein I311_04495 [Cryptococcus gattii NT-10]